MSASRSYSFWMWQKQKHSAFSRTAVYHQRCLNQMYKHVYTWKSQTQASRFIQQPSCTLQGNKNKIMWVYGKQPHTNTPKWLRRCFYCFPVIPAANHQFYVYIHAWHIEGIYGIGECREIFKNNQMVKQNRAIQSQTDDDKLVALKQRYIK